MDTKKTTATEGFEEKSNKKEDRQSLISNLGSEDNHSYINGASTNLWACMLFCP